MTSRAAVVGLGRAGSGWDEWDESDAPPRTHAGCYQRSEKTRLVAVCDTDNHRSNDAGARRNATNYTNVRMMLDMEDVDIVSVCTPPDQHLPVVRDAIEAEVPVVLCEKPLAATLEDACEITRLADESETVVAVMHHRRWMAGLELVWSLLHATRPVFGEAHYYGGMLNNGTHAFDLIRSVLPGRIEQTLPGGVFALSGGGSLSIFDSGEFGVCLWSERYRVEFINGGRDIRVFDYGDGSTLHIDTDYPSARLRAIEQMADIHRSGGEPNCTVHDGLRAVELAYMAMGRMGVAA